MTTHEIVQRRDDRINIFKVAVSLFSLKPNVLQALIFGVGEHITAKS